MAFADGLLGLQWMLSQRRIKERGLNLSYKKLSEQFSNDAQPPKNKTHKILIKFWDISIYGIKCFQCH